MPWFSCVSASLTWSCTTRKLVLGTREDYGVRSSHSLNWCLFFFFPSLLGLREERYKFTSCYVCLVFERESWLKCAFGVHLPWLCDLAEVAFIWEMFLADLKEQLLVAQYLWCFLGYIPVASAPQLHTKCECPLGPWVQPPRKAWMLSVSESKRCKCTANSWMTRGHILWNRVTEPVQIGTSEWKVLT